MTWSQPTLRTAGTALLVVFGVVFLAQLPVLLNSSFYFWDDSAAQFLPMWYRLGERVLAGLWPPMLDLDAWMGGNLAAEALFGIWNPVNVADFLLVVALGDLGLAATVIKTQFLATLGLGTFLLCREYGAARWAAGVLGVAMPVSGFVLYFQAGTWAGGLMSFAWLPWAWWSLRRAMNGRTPVIVAWLFGYLCLSAGDPYGVLALSTVFLGALVESMLLDRAEARQRRNLWLVAATLAAALPLIFLPVLTAGPVSWRSGLALFNVGQLVPSFTDLLNLSMPSFVPQILSFGSFRMTVPSTYLAWFVLPLLPWLDWSRLLSTWRRHASVLVVAAAYVLLCIGPSNVWLFRWPLRHIVVLHLALAVLFSVLLTRGLRTDRARMRVAVTASTLAASAYLSFAAWPSLSAMHLVAIVVTGVLLVLALRLPRWLSVLVLHAGTACMLFLQANWFPANRDVAFYNFPTEIHRLRGDYASLSGGTVVQIADRAAMDKDDIDSRAGWRHLLFGNMHSAAGVPSLVSYTGIGFRPLHRRLCLSYYGSTCPRAYAELWRPDETGVRLVDQMKAKHVVVQRRLVDAPVPPAGWRVANRNRHVTVLSRVGPLPWREGRLSVARNVTVLSDVQEGPRRETVIYRHDPAVHGKLTFARLAWPGYRATVDGRPVPTGRTSAGLVTVSVPPGRASGTVELAWSPPGFAASVALAASGFLLAGGFSKLRSRSERQC